MSAATLNYQGVFDASPNPYLVLDRSLNIIGANRAYLASTKRHLSDILGRWAWDAFPTDPETLKHSVASFERVIRTREPDVMPLVRFDIPRLEEEGGGYERRYWSITHVPVLDSAGEVQAVLQHPIDVTELERLREAVKDLCLLPQHSGIFVRAESVQEANLRLKAEHDRLRELFAQAPSFIAVLAGPEHRFEMVNDAYSNLVGGRDVVGKTVREALGDLKGQDFFELLDRVYQSGESFVGRGIRLSLQKDGTEGGMDRFVDFIYQPVRERDGSVSSVFVIGNDVTEAQRTLSQLQELTNTLEHQVRQRTAALEATLARESAILASAASAIIATDLAGRIMVFNPAAEAMLRIPAREALGRSELDFRDHAEIRARLHLYPRAVLENASQMPEWWAQTAREALAASRVHDGSRHSEWTYIRADGTRVSALLNSSLLRDEEGQPTGFLSVIIDLTERKALEEQLRERTRQAEAANQAKTTFLANMSHEIRTPLNAIIGLSQLLRQRALPEDVWRFIGHIHDAGELLLALVSDVLDLSRIEAGEMALESVAFEPLALLDKVLALVRPQADTKSLALVAEVAPDLPQRLVGDPLRLCQVLLNLLSNAVKFTPSGSVTLRVRSHSPGQQVELRLEVADTGIGIAPEAQERIFDTFTQADGSTTRRFGGSGLGLSIVRRLVDLMSGTLAVQSQPGQGSTFIVEVPLRLA
jgi:signal transduction histidine kinase